MKELTARAFRAWLVERLETVPTGSIGVAGNMARCPLASYLGPRWLVARRFAMSTDPEDDREAPLPRWAQGFVRKVDALPALSGRPNGRPDRRRVWPRLALALLDEALEETRTARRRERQP